MQADIPIAGPMDVPVLEAPPPPIHTEVTAAEAKVLIATNPNLIVVDVRESSEYCATDPPDPLPPGHIPGATLLPWNSGIFQTQFSQDGNTGDLQLTDGLDVLGLVAIQISVSFPGPLAPVLL